MLANCHKVHALKVSCLAKYAQDVNMELSTCEKLSTFKGKCAVKDVNFLYAIYSLAL